MLLGQRHLQLVDASFTARAELLCFERLIKFIQLRIICFKFVSGLELLFLSSFARASLLGFFAIVAAEGASGTLDLFLVLLLNLLFALRYWL